MHRIETNVHVDLTIDGCDIGEWPDHEVTLLIDDDGDLVEVEMAGSRDGRKVTVSINRRSASETAKSIWRSCVAWCEKNPDRIAECIVENPPYAPDSRPIYGAWNGPSI